MRLALWTSVAMMAFAANSVLNRVAVGSGYVDPLSFALIRLVAGAAMLALLVVLRSKVKGQKIWPGWEGRPAGVLGLIVYLAGFSVAYVSLNAGVGALILFGLVQITMFLGALWGREPVPPMRWFGAGLAFFGLVLLVAPGGGGVALWPALSMAMAGVGWGFYSLAGRGAVDPLATTAANFCLALPFGAVAWFWVAQQGQVTPMGLWLAVICGAVTSGLGYALWYAVVPRLGAARAGVAQLTVPVLAGLAGALVLAEPLGVRFIIAAGLVLGGVALASLAGRKPTAKVARRWQ